MIKQRWHLGWMWLVVVCCALVVGCEHEGIWEQYGRSEAITFELDEGAPTKTYEVTVTSEIRLGEAGLLPLTYFPLLIRLEIEGASESEATFEVSSEVLATLNAEVMVDSGAITTTVAAFCPLEAFESPDGPCVFTFQLELSDGFDAAGSFSVVASIWWKKFGAGYSASDGAFEVEVVEVP